jgi:hypothetical protein
MSFGKMVRNLRDTVYLLFIKKKLTDFYFPGTYADYMKNVFPTKTFPNHHSIATGKYPKEHGVLANVIFDKKLGKLKYSYEMFHMNSEDIQPIWVSGRVPNFYQCFNILFITKLRLSTKSPILSTIRDVICGQEVILHTMAQNVRTQYHSTKQNPGMKEWTL